MSGSTQTNYHLQNTNLSKKTKANIKYLEVRARESIKITIPPKHLRWTGIRRYSLFEVFLFYKLISLFFIEIQELYAKKYVEFQKLSFNSKIVQIDQNISNKKKFFVDRSQLGNIHLRISQLLNHSSFSLYNFFTSILKNSISPITSTHFFVFFSNAIFRIPRILEQIINKSSYWSNFKSFPIKPKPLLLSFTWNMDSSETSRFFIFNILPIPFKSLYHLPINLIHEFSNLKIRLFTKPLETNDEIFAFGNFDLAYLPMQPTLSQELILSKFVSLNQLSKPNLGIIKEIHFNKLKKYLNFEVLQFTIKLDTTETTLIKAFKTFLLKTKTTGIRLKVEIISAWIKTFNQLELIIRPPQELHNIPTDNISLFINLKKLIWTQILILPTIIENNSCKEYSYFEIILRPIILIEILLETQVRTFINLLLKQKVGILFLSSIQNFSKGFLEKLPKPYKQITNLFINNIGSCQQSSTQ